MQITYWHWQFDNSQLNTVYLKDYPSFAAGIRNLIPAEHEAGVMVKSHSGSDWQGLIDRHPLGIRGEESLVALKSACAAEGVHLGTWGEARGNPVEAGKKAALSSQAGGYYCLDCEPYSEFRLPTMPEQSLEAVMGHALDFWHWYRLSGGAPEWGVSIAPQASGVEGFGQGGTLAWLHGAAWLHLQTYFSTYPNLHPDRSRPFVNKLLERLGLAPQIIYIVEPGGVMATLQREDVGNYLEVWRI